MHRLTVCVLAALLGAAPSALALRVTGANDPAHDVPALQAAFDGGGTIELSGTFDLGNRTVFITRDGTISAAPGGATIRNGGHADALYGDNRYAAFYVGWDGRVLDAQPAGGEYGALDHPLYPGKKYFPAFRPAVAIRGIRFEASARAAIMVGAARSLTIEDNTISGVSNGAWDEWYVWTSNVHPQTRALGIALSGGFWPPYLGVKNTALGDADNLASMAASLSGPAVVRRNVIRDVGTSGSPYEESGIEPIGIVVAPGAAGLDISSNDISGFPTGGLGVLVISNLQRTVIEGNTVDAPWAGIVGWSFMFDTSYEVRGNAVRAGPGSVGIALEGDTYVFATAIDGAGRVVDSGIRDNRVIAEDAFAAIDMETNHAGTAVTGNVISGTALYGVNTFDWGIPGVQITRARVTGNDLRQLAAYEAQVNLLDWADGSAVADNRFGNASRAVVAVQGSDSSVTQNDYRASGVPGFPSGAGCVLLDAGSSGNVVSEKKFPSGTTAAQQVLDLGSGNVVR